MHRTLTAATIVAFTACLASTGCEVAPLPAGYSWNVRPANDLDHAPHRSRGPRGGLNASGVDKTNAATNRGGKAYNFASALPGVSQEASGIPATATTAAPDLSPPTSAPADLFAGGAGQASDPAVELFGSPTSEATPYRVVLAPTPVTGRATNGMSHVVERGDNLWRLAERYYGNGLRYVDILAANPGIDPNNLKLGDRLVLPSLSGAAR